MRRLFPLNGYFLVLFLIFVLYASIACAQNVFNVTQLTIEGPISPAQSELLDDSVRSSVDTGSDLFLLVLNTPGGLGESMRTMVSTILNAKIPVAVWVGPAGAHAASAGVFVVAASDVAGMAPQSNIGAALPVGLGGGEISPTMAKKVTHDFSSLVRSVAAAHGRNVDWYARSVEFGDSITAEEAVALNVVEYLAATPGDFLSKIGKRGFQSKGNEVHFDESSIVVKEYDTGFRYCLLSWLLNPQISYLLLMAGMLGLFIELTHPGTVFPGVLGGLCLLLGLYAMSILPTNITGLLLILFSIVLFFLEIKVVSYGMLSIAGVAALFIGSVILFKDQYGTLQLPIAFIIWPVSFISAFFVAIILLVVRAHTIQHRLGEHGMVGLVGEVLHWDGETGQISVRGEIWAAKGATSDFAFQRDMRVEIVSIDGLILKIRPFDQ